MGASGRMGRRHRWAVGVLALAAAKGAQVVVTYERLAVTLGPGCRLPGLGMAWDGHVPGVGPQLVRKSEFGVFVTLTRWVPSGRVRYTWDTPAD
jgi:hypothetical protein